jgi:hypothetical protein
MQAQTGTSADTGPIRFARYAYPPNRLGLCGPADAPALIGSAAAGATRELRELALGFEGAYPYLRLIADQNGIADPLDPEVVEAYWIGNGLTAGVRPRALHRSLDGRFRDRMPAADWRWLERAVEGGSRPNHAFHVLEIFPRAGLLRGDTADPVVATIDACRIRWGRVIGLDADRLLVEARPLEIVDGRLRLGTARAESAAGWMGPDGLLGGVALDDWVSLHWGWACDRLSPRRLARLAAWTDRAIASANRAW